MNQITNLFHVKEKKQTIRNLKNKAIDSHFKRLKCELNKAPFTLKVLSYLIPEERKALSALSEFLSSPAGKKFSGMLSRSYDVVAEFGKGNYDAAKEEGQDLIQSYTVDDYGNVVKSVAEFALNNMDTLKGAFGKV